MSRERPRILIFDDDKLINERWAASLRRIRTVNSGFEIQTVAIPTFKEAMDRLRDRHSAARKGNPAPVEDNLLDHVAILIVDYDLFAVENKDLTAEEVAYLARCYSKCGLIVGLNQFGGPNEFDLTLKWKSSSFSDLDVGGTHLDSSGLWKEPWSGFRPWFWPLLPVLFKMWQGKLIELSGRLDEPLLSFFGIPPEVVSVIPREVLAEIAVSNKAPDEVTFRDVVVSSPIGRRRRDVLNDGAILRVGAARVGKWLDQCLLAGQDVLVDAPHLASRYPSIITRNKKGLSAWNATTSMTESIYKSISPAIIRKFEFQHPHWLSRPAWFWPLVSQSEEIPEVKDPWASKSHEFAFCEDVSQFLRREGAREFVADLPSPFIRRFVVNPHSKAGRGFTSALKDVDYTPQAQFAQ